MTTNTGRNQMPSRAKTELKEWLYRHADNPFPTDAEKREMCSRYGVPRSQLNYWFINARRRYLRRCGDAPNTAQGDSTAGSAPAYFDGSLPPLNCVVPQQLPSPEPTPNSPKKCPLIDHLPVSDDGAGKPEVSSSSTTESKDSALPKHDLLSLDAKIDPYSSFTNY